MTSSRQSAPEFCVVRGDAAVPDALKGGVAAIGNFDGVHRGHRAVIDAALTRARQSGQPALAITFEPHPREFFKPEEPVFRLTDEAAKLRLLAASGLDGALVLAFDAAFAAMRAEAFVRRVLVERLAIAGAAVGYDFHFGHDREGSPAFLAEQGRQYGFAVDVVAAHAHAGARVSSSEIRSALEEGRVADAAAMLGHAWFVSGSVLHGEKRGRDLGYPTANIRLDPGCGLRHGIYAVRAGIDGRHYDGVASFGRRPTFDNGAPLLEVFLFDFTGDLYGRAIDVAFVDWVRPELRFDGVEALIRQMDADSAAARSALARAPAAMPPA